MTESIRQNGVQQPIIIRDVEEQEGLLEYIILSGHNRVEAVRALGHESIPAIIRTMDDVAAAMTVVQTNFAQREMILPSEKAYAYKLMLETFKKDINGNSFNDSADSSTG